MQGNVDIQSVVKVGTSAAKIPSIGMTSIRRLNLKAGAPCTRSTSNRVTEWNHGLLGEEYIRGVENYLLEITKKVMALQPDVCSYMSGMKECPN